MFDGVREEIGVYEPAQEAVSGKLRGLSMLDVMGRVLMWLRQAAARHRQRQALRTLDDRLLADVGISPDDAKRECGKPFWR